MNKEKVALGIDLGTTFTCAAVYRRGNIEVITDSRGRRIIPSSVTFGNDGRVVAKGEVHQSSSEINNTVFGIKRLIGRSYDDPTVQASLPHWPFKVNDVDNKPVIEVELFGREVCFAPEEISAMILSTIKTRAQKIYGRIDEAVIAVPAYFNNAQRQATKDAGEIAGFDVLRILSEPTAAVLSYKLQETSASDSKAIVFDFGGGTLDVTLLEVKNRRFVVGATSGNSSLGGEDFTSCLVDHFVGVFNRKNKVEIRNDLRAMSRLRRECERAKCNLSYDLQECIYVDALFNGIDFAADLHRRQFEKICSHLFETCRRCIDHLLSENNVPAAEIKQVVLSGGSSQMSEIQRFMTARFSEANHNTSLSMSEAVAGGAAIQAFHAKGGKAKRNEGLVADITPFSLGIEGDNGFFEVLVKRDSSIPLSISKEFTTVSNYQPSVICAVYEGEHDDVHKNSFLGSFELGNIQKKKKGVPILEVTFNLDPSGILTVSEEDQVTKVSKQIQINGKKNSLKKDQIAGMKRVCEDFASLEVTPGHGKVLSYLAANTVRNRILKARASL